MNHQMVPNFVLLLQDLAMKTKKKISFWNLYCLHLDIVLIQDGGKWKYFSFKFLPQTIALRNFKVFLGNLRR